MADPVRSIIVDDEPDRGILTKYLGECGFFVTGAAGDGQLHIRAERALARDGPIPKSISWTQIRKVFDSLPIRIALLDLNTGTATLIRNGAIFSVSLQTQLLAARLLRYSVKRPLRASASRMSVL
jgi:hypothetical protein